MSDKQPYFVDSFTDADLAAMDALAARFFEGGSDIRAGSDAIRRVIEFRRGVIWQRKQHKEPSAHEVGDEGGAAK